jgi:hypothetical protein
MLILLLFVKIRIFARKQAAKAGYLEFAKEVIIKILDFYENVYLNMSEPVPPKIGKLTKN